MSNPHSSSSNGSARPIGADTGPEQTPLRPFGENPCGESPNGRGDCAVVEQPISYPIDDFQSSRRAAVATYGSPDTPHLTCKYTSLTMYRPETDKTAMIRQLETTNISNEQLMSEMRQIYAELLTAEAKCVEVDKRQHQVIIDASSAGRQPILNNERWQELSAVHRTLLHQHHDFFLVSQHPAASPALKKLAKEYDMPSRMWRHGIHSFLELQRHHLPYSLEQMLTFIHLAYSMMALLYETVPAFEITWIECLGDLARYRLAIEDQSPRERQTWEDAARGWYKKGSGKTPTVGRLYHHLATVARSSILTQLFYYCKSLSVSQPFSAARESILMVFDPTSWIQSSSFDTEFVQLHSIIFTRTDLNRFDKLKSKFVDCVCKYQLSENIVGCYIAVCNITALHGYGAKDSLLRKAWKERRKDATGNPECQQKTEPANEDPADEQSQEVEAYDASSIYPCGDNDSSEPAVVRSIQEISCSIQQTYLDHAKLLAYEVLEATLKDIADPSWILHWHTWLAFLHHITGSIPAMRLVENTFPWAPLLKLLNHLMSKNNSENVFGLAFPHSKPLPEDYILRGLEFVGYHYPYSMFNDLATNFDREVDNPSMAKKLASLRLERLLWLALRISEKSDWLEFNQKSRSFNMNNALKERILSANVEISETEDEIITACTNSDDEDYIDVQPERKQDKKRRLEAQVQSAAGLVVVSEIVKGVDALALGITAFVVDTNILVSHLHAFNLIIGEQWCVIIPELGMYSSFQPLTLC